MGYFRKDKKTGIVLSKRESPVQIGRVGTYAYFINNIQKWSQPIILESNKTEVGALQNLLLNFIKMANYHFKIWKQSSEGVLKNNWYKNLRIKISFSKLFAKFLKIACTAVYFQWSFRHEVFNFPRVIVWFALKVHSKVWDNFDIWKLFKKGENCFLFHLKSSFRSQDI